MCRERPCGRFSTPFLGKPTQSAGRCTLNVSSTTNRVITALSSADDAGAKALESLAEQLGNDVPSLVCVFAAIAHDLRDVLDRARARWPAAVVIGSSSAGEFTQTCEAKSSVTALAIAGDFEVRSGFSAGLHDDPEATVRAAIRELPAQLTGYPHRTAIMLLDPLSGRSEEATLLAAALLEHESPVRLVGGAAGDDLSMTKTFVGVGPDIGSDAIALAMIYSKRPFGIGVKHGHRALSQPFTVTKSDGNVVYELDGRPAWDVWREETRTVALKAGVDVDNLAAQDIGAFLLTYEAALTSGSALKVRAPLKLLDDGALSFACGIAQGSVLRITQSDPEGQIESAREAAAIARRQLGNDTPAGALVFDCICRNLILGDTFSNAVSAMSEELGGVPVGGFETYGEIALDVGDMSGFHNTTSVVLAVPR